MRNKTFCTVLLSTNNLVPSYYLTLNLETTGYFEITEIMTEYYWNVTFTIFLECPHLILILSDRLH